MHLATLGACGSLMQKSGLCRASADNGRAQCKQAMESGKSPPLRPRSNRNRNPSLNQPPSVTLGPET